MSSNCFISLSHKNALALPIEKIEFAKALSPFVGRIIRSKLKSLLFNKETNPFKYR